MTRQNALLLDDPWQVNPANFPERGTSPDKLLFLLNYAALAPSILNTQPWRFRITNDTVALLADPARRLPVTDPNMRELTISCGAALLNLYVAARSFGYDFACTTSPVANQPEILAQLSLRPTTTLPLDHRLRDAITARRTNRGAFGDRSLPKDLTAALSEASDQEGAMLTFMDDPKDKQQVLKLVAAAEQALVADPAFRNEMSRWIEERINEGHERDSEARRRLEPAPAGTGQSPESMSRPEHFPPMAAGIARSFARAGLSAENERDRAKGAPLFALLSTRGDNHEDWLTAGQALQRVLLLAAADGVSASFHNSAIEVKRFRVRIAKAFGARGSAQVLLRLGYASNQMPTARRPARELIL